MKKLLLIPITLLVLAGCSRDDRDTTTGYVKYEVVADGCTVKYVENPKGYNFFIAKCPAESQVITHQRASGKTTTTEVTVVTSEVESLKQQLKVAEAKKAALDKLTEEERQALGIK